MAMTGALAQQLAARCSGPPGPPSMSGDAHKAACAWVQRLSYNSAVFNGLGVVVGDGAFTRTLNTCLTCGRTVELGATIDDGPNLYKIEGNTAFASANVLFLDTLIGLAYNANSNTQYIMLFTGMI